MPDYATIYDHVMASHPGYADPAHSPGCQRLLMERDRVRACGGPALDVGCGRGYAVELLRGRLFGIDAVGVDVSGVAVDAGNERMGGQYLRIMEAGRIPFPDCSFPLVTCFDVLEHLDECDVLSTRDELVRVLQPGGLLLCTAATRPAGSLDALGDNLHRTVRPPWWWCDVLDPDEAHWERRGDDLLMVITKSGG